MPAFTPAGFVREESHGQHPSEPNLTLWISEAGGLGQFGACIEVLRSRAPIRRSATGTAPRTSWSTFWKAR